MTQYVDVCAHIGDGDARTNGLARGWQRLNTLIEFPAADNNTMQQ